MGESFEFEQPEHFIAGVVGPRGNRTFYLQAGGVQSDGIRGVVTLKVEKQQVSALADYIDELLADLPVVDAPAESGDLIEPVEPAWVVGALGVAYEEDDDRLVLVAEELVAADDDAPASLRVTLSRAQARAFVGRARDLVAAGRPPCRICGRPADLSGPVCIVCCN